MALVKCKECKNMISRDATLCPHCGKPKPKNSSGCGLAIGIIVILLIVVAVTSNKKSDKTNFPAPTPSNSTPATIPPPQTRPHNASAPTASPPLPTQKPSDTLVEPKWDERMSYWKDQLRGSFKQPSIGQNIEVILTSGVVHRGLLKELTDQSVTLQIEQGTLTFNRVNIRQDSRLKIFVEDFLSRYAGDFIKSEKETYRARILERQAQEQKEILAREQERKAQEIAQRKENVKTLFSSWDGSLPSLVRLTKAGMNDPKSFEHVETRWLDNGTDLTVIMTYRGKNGFGALVLGSIKAKVDFEGNVFDVLATEP